MSNRIFHYRPLNIDLAALLLRITIGGIFIYYGYIKLSGYSEILKMFGDPIGIGTKLSLQLVIFAEFFCGAFVLLGFFTRLTIIPIMVTMTVAYFVAHANDPFLTKHTVLVYLFLSLVIFTLGSGRFSIDRLLFKKSPNG